MKEKRWYLSEPTLSKYDPPDSGPSTVYRLPLSVVTSAAVFLQEAMSYSTVLQGQGQGLFNLLGVALATAAHNSPLIKFADGSGASFPGTRLYGACLVSLQGPAQGQHWPRTSTY